MAPPTNMTSFAATELTDDAEVRAAWWSCGAVLLTLTLVKPLGGIPVVGTLGFTLAAAMQLYLPMWRCDRRGLGYEVVGLHLQTWRADLKGVFILAAICFPPYLVGYHFFMTEGRAVALGLGWPELARYIPEARLSPRWPTSWWAWGASILWFLQVSLTHALGVALPEETFYRGYFLPALQRRWSPVRKILGAPMGRAVVVSAALFALGHFLGEWNPLRLGPFFPALVFSWQRNRTGSVFGAIVFHAACNVLGEVAFTMYR